MAHASKDNAHGGYEPYYVPEQSKFPFLASIGLFVMVYGLGNVLNEIEMPLMPVLARIVFRYASNVTRPPSIE